MHCCLIALLLIGQTGAPSPDFPGESAGKSDAAAELLNEPSEATTTPGAGEKKAEDPSGAGAPPTQADLDAAAAEGAEATGEGESSEADQQGGAEEEADEEEGAGLLRDIFSTGAIGYLLEGGPFMWPILILAIVAFGVMIERYRSLRLLRTDSWGLRSQVGQMLERDEVEEAFRLCDREQGPVPAILAAGLRKFVVLKRLGYSGAQIEGQVVKAMDDYSVHIVAALERHLPILATISSVAPMLGFLGTVQGMIVAFADIVSMEAGQNIVEAAAAGIKVSLLTTCFGLMIGIPAFMAFNYFSGVINRFVLEVEEAATELIERVTLENTLRQVAGNGQSAEPEPEPLPAATEG